MKIVLSPLTWESRKSPPPRSGGPFDEPGSTRMTPQELQSSISYRNLLLSPNFKSDALMGPYRMTANYVARPG